MLPLGAGEAENRVYFVHATGLQPTCQYSDAYTQIEVYLRNSASGS